MTGLVLAGGLSTRFGRDKALAVCPGDSDARPCFLRVVDLLSSLPCVDHVAVSCRREQEAAFRALLPHHVSLVFDEEAEEDNSAGPTPLRGLYAALRAFGGPLLVLPCDMPYMQASMLRELVLSRDEAIHRGSVPLRTSFIHPDGVIEGLTAIYEAESLSFVREALMSRKKGLYSLVPATRQVLVENAEDTAFWNMNTMESAEESLNRPRKPWCRHDEAYRTQQTQDY